MRPEAAERIGAMGIDIRRRAIVFIGHRKFEFSADRTGSVTGIVCVETTSGLVNHTGGSIRPAKWGWDIAALTRVAMAIIASADLSVVGQRDMEATSAEFIRAIGYVLGHALVEVAAG